MESNKNKIVAMDDIGLDFSYIHALFIIGAVVTYLVDLVLGKISRIFCCWVFFMIIYFQMAFWL